MASPTFAATPTPEPASEAPRVVSTSSTDTPPVIPTEANQLFAEAEERYGAGDLPGAVVRLERCFTLTKDANLLFNLAQLYRELSDCPKALDYYRRYVEADPEGIRIYDAKQYLATLSQQCPAETPKTPVEPVAAPATTEPKPPAITSPPELPRSSHWTTLGWVSLGSGALAITASALFTVGALHAKHDTEQSHISAAYYDRRNSDLFRNSLCAGAFGATAIVAVGFGIYSLAVAAPKERRQTTAWSVSVSPNTVLLGASAQF